MTHYIPISCEQRFEGDWTRARLKIAGIHFMVESHPSPSGRGSEGGAGWDLWKVSKGRAAKTFKPWPVYDKIRSFRYPV